MEQLNDSNASKNSHKSGLYSHPVPPNLEAQRLSYPTSQGYIPEDN